MLPDDRAADVEDRVRLAMAGGDVVVDVIGGLLAGDSTPPSSHHRDEGETGADNSQ